MARERKTGLGVAAELGWTQNYLWRRLHGKMPFSVDDLVAISEVLEVPITTFFEVRHVSRGGGQLPDELVNALAVAA